MTDGLPAGGVPGSPNDGPGGGPPSRDARPDRARAPREAPAAPEAAAPEAAAPEAAATEVAAPEAAAPEVHDPGRRRFFRLLAADAIQAAATVVGVVTALQRSSAEAAAALLDDGSGVAARAAGIAPPPTATASHHSPFRMEDDRLVVLDQARFPFEAVEIDCVTGAEASRAIREMAVRGGPAIAQVAAYGLALTANRVRTAKPYVRLATIRGTANALVNARVAPIATRRAVDRLLARMAAVGELIEDGDAIADAIRDEADAIAFEATLDHARLVEAGRAALEDLVTAAEAAIGAEPVLAEAASPAERALGVLTLGSTGALAGGQVGTALGVVAAYAATGRPVHVFVLETRPSLDGARLAAWELGQGGIPYTILVDAAVGWLLARGEVDVVLVGADRVARDGSVLAPIGTLPLALAATSAGVPVWACAPGSAIDTAAATVEDLPEEIRTGHELLRVRGADIAAPGSAARDPIVDATPAELVAALVTEAGVLRSPFGPAVENLAASIAARGPVSPALRRGAGRPTDPMAPAEPAEPAETPDRPADPNRPTDPEPPATPEPTPPPGPPPIPEPTPPPEPAPRPASQPSPGPTAPPPTAPGSGS